MQAFMKAHKAAYGATRLKPKHHYAMHNAVHRDAGSAPFLDCFVHERKHQVAKHQAEPVKNTRAFEASVLAGVLLEQTKQLDELRCRRGLVGPTSPSPELAYAMGVNEAMVAKSLRYDGLQVSTDDLVMVTGQAVVVKACVSVAAGLFMVVQVLAPRGTGRSSSTWSQADEGKVRNLTCV